MVSFFTGCQTTHDFYQLIFSQISASDHKEQTSEGTELNKDYLPQPIHLLRPYNIIWHNSSRKGTFIRCVSESISIQLEKPKQYIMK